MPKPEPNSYRLVTDFTSLNRFLKRLPLSSPTIAEARAALARKKYFAEIDLSNYFFQGGLRRGDCSYLAIQHLFSGVYVYTASPQGLKNSSEVSYERLGKVYGPIVQKNQLTRMADGLYVLADSEEELLVNYEETLRKGGLAGFTFKPTKTVISPRNTTIFGWTLSDGEWKHQEHVISSLSRSERPNTVKQLRSFSGSYKQISECVPEYAVLLSDFEQIVGSRGSAKRVIWTDKLKAAFNKAKEAVKSCRGVHFPMKTDRLITSSDYSHQHKAIGGLMAIIRQEEGKQKKLLGRHFSAKLDKNKSVWLPCEGEAFRVK